MKIICSKESLNESINIVSKAISSKSSLPILESILLQVKDNKFIMAATDNEIAIQNTVPAVIMEEGEIAINAKMFGDIIRKLPDAEVSIETDEKYTMKIECGQIDIQLKGIATNSFPASPEFNVESTVELVQKDFRNMVRQTIFAVGIDDMRPILTGSLLECDGAYLNMVSIDGNRIALKTCSVPVGTPVFKVVIPGKTLNEIAKILLPVEEKVIVEIGKNQIRFRMNDCIITSNLLEGEFFNYKSAIPQTFGTNIIVSKKEITNSIDLASTITMSEKRYPVKITVENESIMITSNAELGNIKKITECQMEGSKIVAGFNPRYFADALKVIEDEEIKICFTSAVGPCVIRPVDREEYIYLILPLRLKEE